MAKAIDRRDVAPPQGKVPDSPAGDRATLDAKLPMDRMTLIGTMGSPEARVALLRRKSGQIVRLKVGDRLSRGATVEAVGDGTLHIANANGSVTRLAVPE